MMRFINLVSMELNRLSKVLVGGLVVTMLFQIAAIIIETRKYIGDINDQLRSGISKDSIIETYGYMNFSQVSQTPLFLLPIALCAGALFFYIFLIWYRDWTGKNTFIYRLLMLPTSRLNVFLAKAVSILLIVLGLVAFQLAILPLEIKLLHSLVPADFLDKWTLTKVFISHPFFSIIIPGSFIQFILHYGAGFIVLTVLFTTILLERSYRWKGIILGILFAIGSMAISISPVIILGISEKTDYFYNSEIIMMLVGTCSIVGIISILFSRYLLNKKVTV